MNFSFTSWNSLDFNICHTIFCKPMHPRIKMNAHYAPCGYSFQISMSSVGRTHACENIGDNKTKKSCFDQFFKNILRTDWPTVPKRVSLESPRWALSFGTQLDCFWRPWSKIFDVEAMVMIFNGGLIKCDQKNWSYPEFLNACW